MKNNMLVIFLAGLAVFGSYGFSSTRFQMKFIPVDTSGLHQIGKTSQASGDVFRKFQRDSLWFPIDKDVPIYEGDSVYTTTSSAAEIWLDDTGKNKISLFEDTVVRIFLLNNKFLILLKEGRLSADLQDGKVLLLKVGTETRELPAGKKPLLISKNGTGGNLSVKNDEPPSKPELTEQNPPPKPSPSEIKPKYPYPSENSMFLHQRGGNIVISPKDSCESSCTFQVYTKQRLLFEKNFETGSKVHWTFIVPSGFSDLVYWKVQDGSSKSEGHFEVRPFDKKYFAEALKNGRSIEMMEP